MPRSGSTFSDAQHIQEKADDDIDNLLRGDGGTVSTQGSDEFENEGNPQPQVNMGGDDISPIENLDVTQLHGEELADHMLSLPHDTFHDKFNSLDADQQAQLAKEYSIWDNIQETPGDMQVTPYGSDEDTVHDEEDEEPPAQQSAKWDDTQVTPYGSDVEYEEAQLSSSAKPPAQLAPIIQPEQLASSAEPYQSIHQLRQKYKEVAHIINPKVASSNSRKQLIDHIKKQEEVKNKRSEYIIHGGKKSDIAYKSDNLKELESSIGVLKHQKQMKSKSKSKK